MIVTVVCVNESHALGVQAHLIANGIKHVTFDSRRILLDLNNMADTAGFAQRYMAIVTKPTTEEKMAWSRANG